MRDVREKIRGEGGDILGGTPEAFGNLIKTDVVKWARSLRNPAPRWTRRRH
jgi:hypothetical protein